MDASLDWFPVKSAPNYEISLRGGVRRVDTKEPAVVTNGCIQMDLPSGGRTLVPTSDLTALLLEATTTEVP